MKKAITIASVVAAFVALAASALWWMHAQCHVPVGRAAIKATNSIGCAEFWLNRYQTLITGIAAFLVAAIGAVFVRHQLRSMEASRAISLQDALIRRSEEIYGIRDAYSSWKTIAKEVGNVGDVLAAPLDDAGLPIADRTTKFSRVCDEIGKAMDTAYAASSRYHGGTQVASKVRRVQNVFRKIRELYRDCSQQIGELNQQYHPGNEYKNLPAEYTDVCRRHGSRLKVLSEELEQANLDLLKQLVEEAMLIDLRMRKMDRRFE